MILLCVALTSGQSINLNEEASKTYERSLDIEIDPTQGLESPIVQTVLNFAIAVAITPLSNLISDHGGEKVFTFTNLLQVLSDHGVERKEKKRKRRAYVKLLNTTFEKVERIHSMKKFLHTRDFLGNCSSTSETETAS